MDLRWPPSAVAWMASPWRSSWRRRVSGACRSSLGIVAREQGDFESALAYHKEGLSLHQEHGEPMGISQAFFNLGRVALAQGDYVSARSLLEESLSIRRKMGWRRGFAMPLAMLGEVAFERGDYAAARSLLEESL